MLNTFCIIIVIIVVVNYCNNCYLCYYISCMTPTKQWKKYFSSPRMKRNECIKMLLGNEASYNSTFWFCKTKHNYNCSLLLTHFSTIIITQLKKCILLKLCNIIVFSNRLSRKNGAHSSTIPHMSEPTGY